MLLGLWCNRLKEVFMSEPLSFLTNKDIISYHDIFLKMTQVTVTLRPESEPTDIAIMLSSGLRMRCNKFARVIPTLAMTSSIPQTQHSLCRLSVQSGHQYDLLKVVG